MPPKNFVSRVYAERGGRARPRSIDVGAGTGAIGLTGKAKVTAKVAGKLGLAGRLARAVAKSK